MQSPTDHAGPRQVPGDAPLDPHGQSAGPPDTRVPGTGQISSPDYAMGYGADPGHALPDEHPAYPRYYDPAIARWVREDPPTLPGSLQNLLAALADFFSSDGPEWLQLPQYVIARAAGCSRVTVNRLIPKLVDLEKLQIETVVEHGREAAHRYRLAGADTRYQVPLQGSGSAASPEAATLLNATSYLYRQKLLGSQQRVRQLEALLSEDGIAIPAVSDFRYREEAEEVQNHPGTDSLAKASSASLHEHAVTENRYSADRYSARPSEKPDDIEKRVHSLWPYLSVPTVNMKSLPWALKHFREHPGELAEKERAAILEAATAKERSRATVEQDFDEPLLDTPASAEAQTLWAEALEILGRDLSKGNFEINFRGTEGHHVEGTELIVLVPLATAIGPLERIYASIVKAIRRSSGREDLGVRFAVAAAGAAPEVSG